ncbi:MAG: ABC transporter substrate-binding protein [Thermodesulfobacteriota bacterium]
MMRVRNVLTCMVIMMALLIACSSTASAQEPIKIGFVHVFSGGMATFGQVAKQGADLAVQEINSAGGVDGRMIALVYADTEVKPAVATEAIKNLVEKEKVVALAGVVSSAVADAATPLMAQLQCPLIITHAMATDVTGAKCNPWTFRITWSVPQCYKGSAMLAHGLGAKKWTTLGPDYGFGQESWKYFKEYLGALGPYAFDEGIMLPMATTDWKPAIEQLKKSGADGVMLSLWGNNLQAFLKQAHEEKFFQDRKVLCPVGGSVEIFVALGRLGMPEGVWFGTPYWYEAYENAANARFVDAYRARAVSKIPPSYAAYNAYAAIKMLAAAIKKGASTERANIAMALSGLTLSDLPVGPTTLRKEDHQAIFDVAFGKTSSKGAKDFERIRGLDPIKLSPGADITPSPADTKCSMSPLQR